MSFFELAQELLFEFEPDNTLLYKDVTWRLEEHVDEVFREYYRCWANNDDCSIIFPIHRSLNGEGVSARLIYTTSSTGSDQLSSK